MATACASWLFQVSANEATDCLMAAESACRFAAICARDPAAENVRNISTAITILVCVRIITHLSKLNLVFAMAESGTVPIGVIIQQQSRICFRRGRSFYEWATFLESFGRLCARGTDCPLRPEKLGTDSPLRNRIALLLLS